VLRRSWDTHLGFGLTHPRLYTIMYGSSGDSPAGSSEAVVVARAELIEAVRRIDGAGRLRLPVEVAADALEAAAVGTALWLIRTGGAVDDPAAVIIRDAVTASVEREPGVRRRAS
jgi:hypothetical protein